MTNPRLLFFCLLCFAVLYQAEAQVADTTDVLPADSLRTLPPDSVSIAPVAAGPSRPVIIKPLITLLDSDPGWAVSDSLPTKQPAQDPTSLLSELPGTFLFDFGASGWPDGWSPIGIAPQDVSLSYNGIPFENSIVGVAEYELLPFSMLQPFRLQAGRFGAPLTVNTRLRGLNAARPLTEIRYRQSNNGLKSALVFHSQQRHISLRRQRGLLGITLGYGGHGAVGEYPGSRLQGARQLLARLRYQHPWGSLELMNLANRRRLGAHGGVQPAGSVYETIYNRFGATVRNADAQRQSLRNDLALNFRKSVLPDSAYPFTAMGYWTAATFRYVLGDTLQARTNRLGYRFSQSFPLGAGELTLAMEGWTEKLRRGSNALPESQGLSKSALHLSALVSLPLDPLLVEIEPTLHKNGRESFVGGRGGLSLDAGWIRLFARAAYTGQTYSWIQEYGWGAFVQPLGIKPESRITIAEAGIFLRGGPFSLEVTGFTNRSKNYVDFVAGASADSITAEVFPSPVQWSGVTAGFGFRKDAARGWYLMVTPTLFELQNPEASAAHSTLAGSLPDAFARGRLGMRYAIFKGDLDFDLYTIARAWPSFQSRTLHPETGLLVLRPVTGRPVDASIAMDVVLEARVRTAKIFLAFENALSHPSIIVGNLLVPDYPLPAQRFRLGVYWPIQD